MISFGSAIFISMLAMAGAGLLILAVGVLAHYNESDEMSTWKDLAQLTPEEELAMRAECEAEQQREKRLLEHLEAIGCICCVDCPFGNGVGGCTVPDCEFTDPITGNRENVPTAREWNREVNYAGD